MKNTEAASACRNCGTPLAGMYCAKCGQREGGADLRFAAAIGDIFGEAFTLDSRLWRTLVALLFRPGFLTAEFIVGHRARYLPPVRLYLVISFLLFFAFSLRPSTDMVFESPDAAVEAGAVLAPPDLERESPSAVRAEQAATVDAKPAAGEAPAASVDEVRGDQGDERDQSLAPAAADAGNANALTIDREGIPPWMAPLVNRLEANAERIRESPQELSDYIREHLPQMMFLMLPLFALLLKCCYLFSPFLYLQHVVFGLHYHSFAYLLFLAILALERFAGVDASGVELLVAFAYLALALRRTYGSGTARALFTSMAICITYGLLLIFGFGAVALAGVLVI